MPEIIKIRKTLGRRLRDERENKGWTIERLAEHLEISSSFMGSVERGEKLLSIENVYKASELLNVTIDSLLKT